MSSASSASSTSSMIKPSMLIRVQYRPIYSCRFCSTRAYGDSLELAYANLDEVPRNHMSMPAPAYAIPVGWVSNGTRGFWCPNCSGARNV